MKRFVYIILLMVAAAGCKKPYDPPFIAAPGSNLVVEGIINTGADPTTIKLSHTVSLSSKVVTAPVSGASLTIEGDDNSIYPLTETSKGIYVSGTLNLSNSRKYRLRIVNAKNQYLSDFVEVVNPPPIDSVSYKIQNNGINIYLSTHDPLGNARYYRWDYQETWIIHSNYYSFYKSDGDTVTERNLSTDQVYQCWQSDTSSVILLGSAASLSKNEVVNTPITFIDPASGKLGAKYSILINQAAPTNNAYSIVVRQYALTGDAYNFWTNLKKNTEQLGSIFDTQPAQGSSNIHSVNNPSETVIGYISAGSVTSQRIFISNEQIPNTLAMASNPVCQADSFYYSYLPVGGYVVINQENEYFNYKKGAQYGEVYVPIAAIFNKLLGTIIGHTGSTAQCVDCTLRGTNTEPVFWK